MRVGGYFHIRTNTERDNGYHSKNIILYSRSPKKLNPLHRKRFNFLGCQSLFFCFSCLIRQYLVGSFQELGFFLPALCVRIAK